MSLLSAGILTGGNEIPQDSLEAYYPFTPSNITATQATDLSGNGNHIERHGVTETPSGASFDGTDDYFGIENLGGFPDYEATMSFWVNSMGDYTPLSIVNNNSEQLFSFTDQNTIHISANSIGIQTISISSDTHIILKKHINGWEVKVDNTTHDSGGFNTATSGDYNMAIGANIQNLSTGYRTGYYVGTMHDVAIYSKKTTDAEDTQLYNNPSA